MSPIWSVNREEARRRVIKLYKVWYREIPYIGNVTDNIT